MQLNGAIVRTQENYNLLTCLLIMMIIQKCIECKILGKQNWRMRILGANFGGGENSTHFNRISNKCYEKNWRMRTSSTCIFLIFLAGKFKIFNSPRRRIS